MTSSASPIPLLVVDYVGPHAGDDRVLAARIRLGGHPLQVILNFSRWTSGQGSIEYVDLPWMLGLHFPSQKAVMDLMARVYAGERIEFPADLSAALVDSDPPSPFRIDPDTEARLDREAAGVDLRVLEIHRTGTYPARITAVMQISGRTVRMEVEFYAGAGRVPVISWKRRSQTLSEAEIHAVQQRLLQEVEEAPR